jgi:hypothetical protein
MPNTWNEIMDARRWIREQREMPSTVKLTLHDGLDKLELQWMQAGLDRAITLQAPTQLTEKA